MPTIGHMGFLRAWWPPVVMGVVVAFLAVGVVEVAGMPLGSAPAPVPASPVARPTSVAPAAIERHDSADVPATTSVPVPPRVTPFPRPKEAAEVREESSDRDPPRPNPAPKRSPRAKSTPTPNPRPTTSRTPPNPTPAPSPSATLPPAPAPVRPAQVLDLRRWKLTLPTGRKEHPAEIRQPALGSLASGSFLRLTPDRGVAFRAPVGGTTTENSAYPRSELREMSAGGQREAAWTNARGRHVMTVTQAITATPRAKPHIVAGQIHDAEDDVVMVRLEGRRLFVESDGKDAGLLDPRYRLGTRFTVSMIATRSGVGIVYNGRRTVRVAEVGRGWYFKVGCYPQSNPDRGDRPTAYGEVVVYALSVRHSAS